MSETCIESARQWMKRLETELTELEAHPDYRSHVLTATGIRQEIERVQQLIALALLRQQPEVPA